MRLVLASLLCIIPANALLSGNFGEYLFAFTNWGITLTIAHLWCAEYLAYSTAVERAHYVLFCLSATMNTVSTFTYWTLLFEFDMSRPHIAESSTQQVVQVLAHLLPINATIYTIRTMDVRIKLKDFWIIVVLGLVYNAWYYFVTVTLA